MQEGNARVASKILRMPSRAPGTPARIRAMDARRERGDNGRPAPAGRPSLHRSAMRHLATLSLLLAAVAPHASRAHDRAPEPAAAATPAAPEEVPLVAYPLLSPETGMWRSARFGMTVEEVLAAFPGEAARLDPVLKLEDGNEVVVGIDRHQLLGVAFRVRFIFSGGKLALVSLRTLPDQYAKPETFERLAKHVAEQVRRRGEGSQDDNFIDLRQVRWKLRSTQVDLKYIPGVVVLLYHPPEAAGAGEKAGAR